MRLAPASASLGPDPRSADSQSPALTPRDPFAAVPDSCRKEILYEDVEQGSYNNPTYLSEVVFKTLNLYCPLGWDSRKCQTSGSLKAPFWKLDSTSKSWGTQLVLPGSRWSQTNPSMNSGEAGSDAELGGLDHLSQGWQAIV